MKLTQLFPKPSKTTIKSGKFRGHNLMLQAGFLAESVAGRYYLLPLGWKVHEKIRKIIKTHMDLAGAQEMITPTLHPIELWQETNRTNTVGFELTTVQDRRGAEFALGGTAEEMFVDLVRKFQLSYKDLPFTLYQFSNKFRDELRARGGLLRVREFIMKDAYSFDQHKEVFAQTYQKFMSTYSEIFKKLGLDTDIVEADNGYIGGEYCHEFQVKHPQGEGRYFTSSDGSYCAHEDIAEFIRDEKNLDEPIKDYREVKALRGTTMQDGAKLHQLPLWQQIKDVAYINERGQFILAVLRGDLDVNEIKLAKATDSITLRLATDQEIRQIGSEPGFLSPVGISKKVLLVGDPSLRTIVNAYGGANKKNLDAVNINIDRDYQLNIEANIAMAQAGFISPNNSGKLIEHRGIEVGNIFQLGTHYTAKMKGANYTNQAGTEEAFYMGCYGIGLGRTMATLAEKYHDEKGLLWPESVAPYTYHLVSLPGGESLAQSVYQTLTQNNIEVLWDDRTGVSAGVKFADADLIGCPYRLVTSSKNNQKIELKARQSEDTKLLSLTELVNATKSASNKGNI